MDGDHSSRRRQNGTNIKEVETSGTNELIKKRFPIVEWLPKYTFGAFLHDLLAGFSVALTELPQGIAFAAIAGLPLQYGLYCGFMGGFVYLFFGSCKDVNIGPTSIIAMMIQPHILRMGYDMGIIITFLSGCVIFMLGLLHLGFVVDFFSYPVISGFTCAAALNIASTQIKGLFGIGGKADKFFDAWKVVLTNLDKVRFWDTLLGIVTIAFLVALKEIQAYGSLEHRPQWSRRRNIVGKGVFMLSLARNALAVILGTLFAYYARDTHGHIRVQITGPVDGGLPRFSLPPFGTTFNGTHFSLYEMAKDYGPGLAFVPLVAILESIAIGKAFSKGRKLDATQEMLALGLCNIAGSFVRSMPITGSFTRTAVNNASGVKTTVGGVITGAFVLLALCFLTSTFRYIPKATLAAVIFAAMYYLFDFEAFAVLWRCKRADMVPLLATFLCGVFASLETGIIVGIGVNLMFVLYAAARPKFDVRQLKLANWHNSIFVIEPHTSILYPATEHLRDKILDIDERGAFVIIDGRSIGNMDATVAKVLAVLVQDVNAVKGQHILFLNFKPTVQEICVGFDKRMTNHFRHGDVEDVIKDYQNHTNVDMN